MDSVSRTCKRNLIAQGGFVMVFAPSDFFVLLGV